MKQRKILGYMGLLPFVACLFLSGDALFLGVSTKQAFVAYSAIILSFMAGTLWRVDTQNPQNQKLVFSNVVSLLAFISLLLERDMALIMLANSYTFLFLYEKFLSKQTTQPSDYMKMRFYLTFLVVVLHITAYLLWYF